MRVHQTYAAETTRRRAQAAEVGQHELGGIAYDDEFDGARSAEQDAHLPACRMRNVAQGARQLRGDELIGGDTSAVEALQRFIFRRGKTLGIAEYDQLACTFACDPADGGVFVEVLRSSRNLAACSTASLLR
jgi:hypothetical protein